MTPEEIAQKLDKLACDLQEIADRVSDLRKAVLGETVPAKIEFQKPMFSEPAASIYFKRENEG